MGDISIVRTLMNANADIEQGNHCDTTPLHIACQNGRVDVARCLLNLAVKLEIMNVKLRTPLISTSLRAKPEVIRLLLRHSAQVNLTQLNYAGGPIYSESEELGYCM